VAPSSASKAAVSSRGTDKGDQLVAIKIIVPRELDEEDQKDNRAVSQKTSRRRPAPT